MYFSLVFAWIGERAEENHLASFNGFYFSCWRGGFFFSPTRLFAPQLLKFLCCLNRSPNLTLCALFVLASCLDALPELQESTICLGVQTQLLLLLAPREAHGCVVLQNMPKKDKPVPAPPPAAAAPAEQFDMVFHCQLAHGSPTRQIRDFANVKQLYEAIGKAFGIKATDVSGNASGFLCVFFWFFFSPGSNSSYFLLKRQRRGLRRGTCLIWLSVDILCFPHKTKFSRSFFFLL